MNQDEDQTKLVDELNKRGIAFAQTTRWSEAIAVFRQALTIKPNDAAATHNLVLTLIHEGGVLFNRGQWIEAAAAFREAACLHPDSAEASYNLGLALLNADDPEASIAAFQTALHRRPLFPDAHNALGWALHTQNRLAAAIEHYRAALAQDPTHAQAEMHLGMALLTNGHLVPGFKSYEARWRAERMTPRHSDRSLFWQGEQSLSGRSILLHAEQGLGDTLQFVRYATMLAERGATVYLEVQQPLKALFASSRLAAGVWAKGELLPSFEFHCPLPTLPLACGTTLETIPQHVPYLSPAIERVARWRDVLGAKREILHVGLCWAGNPQHPNDRRRSIPGHVFSVLCAVPGCRFYSLQQGATLHGAEESMAHLDDFEDFAAAIKNLDLVIAVDTSVAHLAGALGVPTWVLLPFAPDWRWMLGREDTPWYPTARLFRQTMSGDWQSVIRRVSDALVATQQRSG